MESETPGSVPTSMLDHIGKFMETLHKIYTFIEAQQEGNKIKQLFRQSEMNVLLKDCQAGLLQAFETFKIETRSAILNSIEEMKKYTENMHKHLLELISTLSDGDTSDRSSSIYSVAHDSRHSSNSFSILPAEPKIFYGRESELEHVMGILAQPSPPIAILGGCGMGKTSLAQVVLHHLDTLEKFKNRFFVSAESAKNSIELAALIGLHVGLNPGHDLPKPVVQHFLRQPPCLLILDNLETVWEPIQSRGSVEEFLSLLTDISHVALIITMRGAERPTKVQWSHPFLLPLQPLSNDAAQQTFMDITDNSYATKEINHLLKFTDNMPLVVDLVAHLVDYEGLSNVLMRWETEKTSLLSIGYDRRSNLDVSIGLSLSSPRITPGSKELLSLLSILPDGLSDFELVQGNLSIPNILACKAILLATSLAYQDSKKRLRSLMPIREHIQQFSPPSSFLTHSLCKHFYSLLELYQRYDGEQLRPIVSQITLNLGNLQEVLQRALCSSNPNLEDVIYCILSLNSFYRITGRGYMELMNCVPSIFPQNCGHRLETSFFIEVIFSRINTSSVEPKSVIPRAQSHFQHFNDPILECRFYWAAATYFADFELDLPRARQFLDTGLELSKSCGDTYQQCNMLLNIAELKWRVGDHCTAKVHAGEAQRILKLSANLYQKAQVCRILAMCSRSAGNWQESMTQLFRAREFLGLCGLSGGSTDHEITIAQADIHLVKSEYVEARCLYTELHQNTSLNVHFHANALLNLAGIYVTTGRPAKEVYQTLGKAKEIYNSLDYWAIIFCDMIEADLELREQKLQLAMVKFHKYLCSTWGKDMEVVSYCLERLANRKAWENSVLESFWPVIYLAYACNSKDKLALHKALCFIGDVFSSNEDDNTALSLFTVALEGFTSMDVHHSRALCMLHLGDLANKRGEISMAIEFWKSARPLFERSLQAKDVANIDSRLTTLDKAQERFAELHPPVQPLEQLSISNDSRSAVEVEVESGTNAVEAIVSIAL